MMRYRLRAKDARDQILTLKIQAKNLGKKIDIVRTVFLASLFVPIAASADHAPYGGTVFVNPDMITDRDYSRAHSILYIGQVENEIWDHNEEKASLRDAWLFEVVFDDDTQVLFHANMTRNTFQQAEDHVQLLARILGQMPQVCRERTREVDINATGADWSASPQDMTIDLGNLPQELRDGTLEESMLHECVHAALDEDFQNDPAWTLAQRADGAFISDYAEENPKDEDLAETISLHWGLLFQPERFDKWEADLIEATIPNRLAYLRENLTMTDLRQ